MLRRKKRGTKSVVHCGPDALPSFSSEFIEEVCSCEDLDAFVSLMEGHGLWLNRSAASGVYDYLRSLANNSLSDEALSAVTGGVPWAASDPDSAVVSALNSLAERLNH